MKLQKNMPSITLLLFSFHVNADDRNSLINAAHFDQGGLGLPSRDYYFKTDSSTKKIRDAYNTYITKIFTLLGQPSIEACQHQPNRYLIWKQLWLKYPKHPLI